MAIGRAMEVAMYRMGIGGGQTCNIDLSRSDYLFFSFVLLELKPFVLKGKVPGENDEKV